MKFFKIFIIYKNYYMFYKYLFIILIFLLKFYFLFDFVIFCICTFFHFFWIFLLFWGFCVPFYAFLGILQPLFGIVPNPFGTPLERQTSHKKVKNAKTRNLSRKTAEKKRVFRENAKKWGFQGDPLSGTPYIYTT